MPDSAAALSVLVLAWDEAAPTVRTVVEAAPAVGALLVLLPPALPAVVEFAPTRPAQEALAAEPTFAGPATPAPKPASPTLPPAGPVPMPSASPAVAAQLASALGSPPAQPALATPAAATAFTPLAAPAVRVLHVVASQLPASVRSGSFQVPAAPYLGATAPPALVESAATPSYSTQPAATALPAAPAASPPTRNPLLDNELATASAIATALAAAVATSAANSLAPAGAAASTAPAIPVPPAFSAAAETPTTSLAEAAFAAAEILDANPEEELRSARDSRPAATTPADALQLSDAAPQGAFLALGPFGNRLPQVDTSLPPTPHPVASAAVDDPEDTAEERARVFAASVAAARQYTAPDLNSQVIRYARLAVPLALRENSYEVIYAPAWPTWLAALELRQRTQGPLVLHLPALAAGRQPADTAAGWPAELQRQALRQADLVLVETYALARRLRRELGLGPAIVRVVPTTDAAAVARALRRARRRPGLG
ncbi:MAG: glycosyltransferase family 4 protein [Janthinobacterium lividum]